MDREQTARIDAAVVTAAGQRWTKVAMVIARVVDAVPGDLPSGEERLDLISDRIDDLVANGKLEAQGNTKNWRFSEVRRHSVANTS